MNLPYDWRLRVPSMKSYDLGYQPSTRRGTLVTLNLQCPPSGPKPAILETGSHQFCLAIWRIGIFLPKQFKWIYFISLIKNMKIYCGAPKI